MGGGGFWFQQWAPAMRRGWVCGGSLQSTEMVRQAGTEIVRRAGTMLAHRLGKLKSGY